MAAIPSLVLRFQNFDSVLDVIHTLNHEYPWMKGVELGLSELMLNAIEHGNLEITFDEKSELLTNGAIIDEIESRLIQDKYKNRQARLELLDFEDETVVIISDSGPGFDWKQYLDKDIVEVTGLHGRGILLSEQMFKTMTYLGNGNKVVVVVEKH